jgi:hypothetical protein
MSNMDEVIKCVGYMNGFSPEAILVGVAQDADSNVLCYCKISPMGKRHSWKEGFFGARSTLMHFPKRNELTTVRIISPESAMQIDLLEQKIEAAQAFVKELNLQRNGILIEAFQHGTPLLLTVARHRAVDYDHRLDKSPVSLT